MHIESRSSHRLHDGYEFMVECAPSPNLGAAIQKLKQNSSYVSIISRNHKNNRGESIANRYCQPMSQVTGKSLESITLESDILRYLSTYTILMSGVGLEVRPRLDKYKSRLGKVSRFPFS
jgi:hypothetical protein